MINYVNFKRISDLSASILLFIFLSPIFIIISVLILFFDGLPIFYKQKRIGLNGNLFKMYKFRTMIRNADADPLGYMCYENDKRITFLGRFLRKYSLDELPQLFNIISGKMSFVGPRPAVFDEFERENLPINLNKYIHLRNKVKPGLSGLVQIYGRNELSWKEKLVYDTFYIKKVKISNLNYFLIDLYIILRTFLIIFSSRGEFDNE